MEKKGNFMKIFIIVLLGLGTIACNGSKHEHTKDSSDDSAPAPPQMPCVPLVANNFGPSSSSIYHSTPWNFQMNQLQSLSNRERSVSDRERSVTDRERSVSDRERSVTDRERSMPDRKRSVSNRERSVTDRERSMPDGFVGVVSASTPKKAKVNKRDDDDSQMSDSAALSPGSDQSKTEGVDFRGSPVGFHGQIPTNFLHLPQMPESLMIDRESDDDDSQMCGSAALSPGSDRSKTEGYDFRGNPLDSPEGSEISGPSDLSFKSDRSKEAIINFRSQCTSSGSACQSDRSKDVTTDFKKAEICSLQDENMDKQKMERTAEWVKAAGNAQIQQKPYSAPVAPRGRRRPPLPRHSSQHLPPNDLDPLHLPIADMPPVANNFGPSFSSM